MHKFTLPQVLAGTIEIREGDETVKYELAGIRIPMLQRDYAQGRAEEATIRRRFLDAIFRALRGRALLPLDFVYGSIERLDTNNFFIPLDGQQRLTTLFLLHWYIGNRELQAGELNELCSLLQRFSYSTRISAREFCTELCKTRLTGARRPSLQIENAVWYYEVYRQDPTVSSMLVVLDAIHELYEANGVDLYKALDQIGFYVLPLKSFHLTDELYIKMNARGKQLTDFENFKADLVSWLSDENNPLAETFKIIVRHAGHDLPYHLSFSLKLDNDWMRLFWSYSAKNSASPGDEVDRHYMRFVNRYLVHSIAANSTLVADSIDREPFFRRVYNYEGELKYRGFEDYQTVFAEQSTVKQIESVLDSLYLHHADVN